MLAVLYVDQADDYTITNDQGAGGLDDGDEVTWNGETAVTGLIFGTNAFSSIAAAIEAATDGDTIHVAAGTYSETLVINKSLALLGAGANTSIADRTAGSADESIIDVTSFASGVTITASNITLDGFDIVGDDSTNYGVYIAAGANSLTNITIEDNFIHGMQLENGNDSIQSYGIVADAKGAGNTFGTISGLTIQNNAIYEIGGASQPENGTGGPTGQTVTSVGFGINLFEIVGAQPGDGVTITGNTFSDLVNGALADGTLERATAVQIAFAGANSNPLDGVSTGAAIFGNAYSNVAVGVVVVSDESSSVAEDVADFTNVEVMVVNVGEPAPGRATISLTGAYSVTNDLVIPPAQQALLDVLGFTNSDGYFTTRAAAIENSNDGATIQSTPVAVDDTATTDEDTPVTIDVLDNDTDEDGDTLEIVSFTQPQNGTVTQNQDGTLLFTPATNFNGQTTFNYTISDGQGGESIGTVTITVNAVNDPPVAANDSATTTGTTPVVIDVQDNDIDADGDELETIIVTQPTGGTVVVEEDGTITYTANEGFFGTDTFTYRLNDGTVDSNVATVTVTVLNPENTAPVAVDDTVTTDEDTPVTIDVLDNDTDEDGDTLEIVSFTQPQNGTVTQNQDGTLTFTPAENFNGTTTFTYTISDGQGGESTGTVTITVNAVNDPPVAANDTATTTGTTPVVIDVQDNDDDVEGDELETIIVTQPTGGTVVVEEDGTITYTANEGFFGIDTFTYRLNDGTADGNVATVTVTVVDPDNTPPVAVDDSVVVNEDSQVTFNPTENDTDEDEDDLQIISVTQPANGTVTINQNGSLTFTPAENFNGTTTFDYTISDGRGGTATATVTVTVEAVNDAPVAVNDTATTTPGTAVTIDVQDNDSDAEDDDLTTIIVTQPTNGTATVDSEGRIVYTPNAGFQGVDTITYRVNDGTSDSNTATVTITVTDGSNQIPVATADNYTMTGTTLTVASPGVLSNDTDADGDTLTAIVVTTTTKGTLVLNANGSFTYTPGANFDGTDSFTYKANDGTADSATVTVTITNPNFKFVRNLFNDLLGRPGSTAEINAWVSRLANGESRESVARGIRDTNEYRTKLVNSFYTNYLNRTGETAGVNFWINSLAQGLTQEQVIAGFLASPEFFAKSNNSREFVIDVYEELFGAAGDSAGIDFWTGVLDSAGNTLEARRMVARGIIISEAFVEVSVERFFTTLLERPSDSAGRNFWRDQFANSDFLDEFEVGFLTTTEYFGKS